MNFSIALRNLLRNSRRSVMTLSAIVVGLVALLVFGGYARNAIVATQTGYVRFHGHLQIQRQGYFQNGGGNPIAYGISNYQRLVDLVKNDPVLKPMVVVVTPSLRLNGIAGNFANGVSRGVVAVGAIPEEQNKMRLWDEFQSMTETPLVALEGTPHDSVIIGAGVARMLQLCQQLKLNDCPPPEDMPAGEADSATAIPPSIAALSASETPAAPAVGGNRIELLASSARGAPNVAGLNVVKAENWGVKDIDDSLIAIHLDHAQRLVYGADRPQVTAIHIQLAHTSEMPAARARLEQLLASETKSQPLTILDYETLTPIYKQVTQFFDSIFGFMSILIWVIVLFTVGNTMSMAVVERTTEIGTIRAIGRRQSVIRWLFVTEGFMLGVIGVVLGTLFALLIAFLINHGGFRWTPPGYSYDYPVRVRVWGDWGLIIGSAVSLVWLAVLSAWWPARRASKLNIVDALRHV